MPGDASCTHVEKEHRQRMGEEVDGREVGQIFPSAASRALKLSHVALPAGLPLRHRP
jgi:hypothetical protein